MIIDSGLGLLKQVSTCHHRTPIDSNYFGSGSYRWNNNKAAHVCCHQESFSPVSFSTKPSTACLMSSSMLTSLSQLIFFDQNNILTTERVFTHLRKVSYRIPRSPALIHIVARYITLDKQDIVVVLDLSSLSQV